MHKRFFLILFWIFIVVLQSALGQNIQVAARDSELKTILWKITGLDCKQPSYLLGTMHLADAEWLLEYPEFQKVIDSTEFILTEAFTTQPEVMQPKRKDILKAIPLLSVQQYQTLDSFFVARVGEGIVGNRDAENMTVAEMGSAILTTLVSETTGVNGLTKLMDLDLFHLYGKLGRQGDRLDRVAPTEFDSTNIAHAKNHLARSLNYIKNSDKADWNIYQMPDLDQTVAKFKKMDVDYQLDAPAMTVTVSDDFDFIPVETRNRNWMDKIIKCITTKPCLIAVGLGHLYYNTGVVSLLRQKGYQVEPVLFNNLH